MSHLSDEDLAIIEARNTNGNLYRKDFNTLLAEVKRLVGEKEKETEQEDKTSKKKRDGAERSAKGDRTSTSSPEEEKTPE